MELALAGRVSRTPRRALVEENSTNHCTWRSHGDSLVLDSDAAREKFLELIKRYKERYGIQILSYCIMGSHPHVMCKATQGQAAFSRFWQSVNSGFARWYNLRTKGRGQVVRERLRSPLVQDGRHQLEVMRYGDLNPVRANLVGSASAWRWSSHRHYAYGEVNDIVTEAPEYVALGATGAERRRAYLHLFAHELCEVLLVRRSDLVLGPYIGEETWRAHRLLRCGPAPPGAQA